ncbi:hypothetical protein EJ02DRAFT_470840 [Clathrospora elynae]|uniref:Uncharacterized protein n=1 Tax=Clathrospora elynae TaxID=706981 RepID=A0A6A5SBT7_9PLEO|nr:hypothetical protein EJ02DRAFT_470840 [Clathrospora elynae]
MPPPKQHGSVDISRTQRAAVITLHVVAGFTFDQINRSLGIAKSTCIGIVRRAQDATGNSDIIKLLDYCNKENNRKVAGRDLTQYAPFLSASILIQDAAKWFPRETWSEAVRNHTPFASISRRTIDKICRQHPYLYRDRHLTRVNEVHKPPLSNELRELRVDYARWCLF